MIWLLGMIALQWVASRSVSPRCTKIHSSMEDFIVVLYSSMPIMLNGMSEISQTIAKLPVFYKQRDIRFYPSWAYSLPPFVLKIPLSFVEVFGLVFLTYYVIGFDPNVGRLFKKYLLLILINQMESALLRFTAAAGRNIIIANTLGTFALFARFALGGFIISRATNEIKKWWIWAYWISPLMYEQNAVVVNEFLGDSWSHVKILEQVSSKFNHF